MKKVADLNSIHFRGAFVDANGTRIFRYILERFYEAHNVINAKESM